MPEYTSHHTCFVVRAVLPGKRQPDDFHAYLLAFYGEVNKVLTGVIGGAAADRDASSSNTVSEVFQTFWCDGRKYQIFLHPIVQTASELPPGIFSSCNNLFAVQTKNPKDRDLVLAQIGRSEKGFVNTEYKRYLARTPKGLAAWRWSSWAIAMR